LSFFNAKVRRGNRDKTYKIKKNNDLY
jgi:hypothetical protein